MYPQESKKAAIHEVKKLAICMIGFAICLSLIIAITNVAIGAAESNNYGEGIYLIHTSNYIWLVGMLVSLCGMYTCIRELIYLSDRAPRLSAWLMKNMLDGDF